MSNYPVPKGKKQCDRAAVRIVKRELKSKGMNFVDLAAALETVGVTTNNAAISKKLRDEGLSAAFLLQVLHLCGSDVASELLQQVPAQ